MKLDGISLALIGPLSPPAGGMANQTQQLAELLRGEGANVTVVQVNAPYRPRWVASIPRARAVFRLVPYLARLWQTSRQVDLFHVMANSGWSWHLFAAPAVWIATIRRIPVIVNYRGGDADSFLTGSWALVRNTLQRADAVAVPSTFLHTVFERHGIRAEIVPNIVDLERFRPDASAHTSRRPHLVVARNLEPIYDIPTALGAFALIRRAIPDARLTVAGSGPEQPRLAALAAQLDIAHSVHFCGRLDRDQMAMLYRSASVLLNPSRIDNMPNSVLEAMATGVPVVSTAVGGIPSILRDGETGLLVPPGDSGAMSDAAIRILRHGELADHLRNAAMAEVRQYSWPIVKGRWADLYAAALASAAAEVRPA